VEYKYYYDTAQVCLSGHVITHRVKECASRTKNFCTICGEPTTTKCSNCSAPIKGFYSGDSILADYTRPNYCHDCGKPYPWTENAIIESSIVIDKDLELSIEDKEEFKQAITSLVKSKESPSRFKTFLKKTSKATAQSLKDILIDVLSESISKSIWS